MKYRTEFAKLINERNYKTFIEIGVALGGFSKYLLENSNLEKLYAIDPWENSNVEFKCSMQKAKENCINVSSRMEFIQLTSNEALNMFENNSIDMIYIDGNHEKNSVTNDLENYFQKIKVGGIISGHDYGFHGVTVAVDEFVAKYNLILNVTTELEFPDFIGKNIDYDFGMENGAHSFYIEKL